MEASEFNMTLLSTIFKQNNTTARTATRLLLLLAFGFITVLNGQPDRLLEKALFNALQEENLSQIRELINEKPDLVNAKNTDGAYPLHVAILAGNSEIVQLLIAGGADVNSLLPNGRTALHLTENPQLIHLLINSGANPLIEDNRGRSPTTNIIQAALLFVPQRQQKKRALTAFLEAGATFPSAGEAGRFFLHYACILGHSALVEHLIEKGASLHSFNNAGGTVLHSAAAGGLVRQIDQFLKSGFDVNQKDRYGLTPLFHAATEGHFQAVSRLMEAGADHTIISPAGITAADYATDYQHHGIAQLLNRAGLPDNPNKTTALSGKYLGAPEPGLRPALFAPGVVSTVHFDHSAAVFSRDGKEVYWSAVYTSRGDYILSMKLRDGTWSAPQIEPFCRPGGTYMYPTLSSDGQRLFFTSDHAVPGAEPGQEMNIWFVQRKTDGWSDPQLVGFPNGNEYGLSISDDGTLYFMADYAGGYGSTDLYRSISVDGKYGTPINLGPSINSQHYEDEPFISPDQSFLLFASLRPAQESEGRLYISRRANDESWIAPQPISSRFKINGSLRFVQMSPDGKYVFFASNENGNWDIYWVDAAILAD